MKIAREGYPWILAASIFALVTYGVGWTWVSGVCAVVALSCAGFFRDPDRKGPTGEGLVLAPADGRVVAIIQEAMGDGDSPGGETRVSIFLSLLNVHVNRAPIKGRVEYVRYQPGRFIAAFKEEASHANEQNAVRLTDAGGNSVGVVQIAGLLARRIICYVRKGQDLERGQRLGIIIFGSRVDLYLPRGSTVEVTEGQRVKGGETVIGRLS